MGTSVFLPKSIYVTQTTERRDTGTQYTPKDLADEIITRSVYGATFQLADLFLSPPSVPAGVYANGVDPDRGTASTQFTFKTNLRSLFNFVSLRTAPNAMLEIREYAKVIEMMAREVAPIAFEAFDSSARVAP